MALQVWLPLNGNLNNQGLSNVTVTNNGATIDDNGKIGKCYKFNPDNSSSGQKYLMLNKNLSDILPTNGKSFSFACWIKITGNLYSNGCGLISANQYKATGVGLYINNSTKKIHIHMCYNGTEQEWIATKMTALQNNVWYHVTYTYNETGRQMTVYINGVNVDSTTANNVWVTRNEKISIGKGSQGGWGYTLPGFMNDVRIYDHCLSPREVHEISQALVLHYKLDDMYSESTTNLATYSTTYSNKTSGSSFGLSGWGGDAGTCTCYSSGGYNNGPYKVYHKTSIGTGGIFWKAANDIHIEAGKTYTMSVYVKASRDYTDSSYSFNINRGSDNHYITYSQGVHFTTEWRRIERTFTASSSETGDYGEMSIIYNDDVTDYYVYYSCFQIEEKDHATPFVIGTRNGAIFDDSGYQNNGTITGNLQIKNNSPRYRYCAQFADSATSIGIGNLSTLLPEGVFTFNIWFKKITDEWSSKTWETIFGGPSGFELETKNGSTNSPIIKLYNWGGGTTSYSLDQWNMITFCRNSSETKLYLNGELKITGSSGSVPSGNYFIGAWNSITQQNYRGYLSDARLYATTLSESDIKSLYNVGAVIDNRANMYTYEYHEIESTTPKVHKTGVTDSSAIIESDTITNASFSKAGIIKAKNFYEI